MGSKLGILAQQNSYDYFTTQREFNERYPSRVYKCYQCGRLTIDADICCQCGAQANVLFGDTYRYKIGSEPIRQIFKPIEISNDTKSRLGIPAQQNRER